MSRSEDYLDNLLTSVTDKLSEFDDDFEQNRESLKESYQTQNDLPPKTQSALDEIREENFLREFEDELNRGNTDDDFLAEFERELNGETDDMYAPPQAGGYRGQTERATDHMAGADAPPSEADQTDGLAQMDMQLEDLFKDDAPGTLPEADPHQGQRLDSNPPVGSAIDPDLPMGQALDSGLPTDPGSDSGLSTGQGQLPDIDWSINQGQGQDQVQLPDSDLPIGQLPDSDLPVGQLPDSDLSTGQLPDSDLPVGQLPDPDTGQLSDSDLPMGQLPDSDLQLDQALDSGLPMGQDADQDLAGNGSAQDSAFGSAPEEEPVTGALEMPELDMGEDVFSQMENEQDKTMEAPKGMEGLEDIFGDLGDADSLLQELENGGLPSSDGDTAMPQQEPETVLDDRLEEILNGSDDEALSEIDRLLDTDGGDSAQSTDAGQDPLSMGPDFSYSESSLGEEEPGGKKKRERNKSGLFGRLSRILFGTPEELDPEAAAEYEAAKAAMGQSQEADAKALKEKKKQEKELKKQQKKEEAEKKKQEKDAAKAEKAAKKESKPKKEKKPKQKDKVPKEPPLPKVPVMMMWALALSIMVLVFLGTTLVGYSTPVKESKEAFANGDYVTAYTKLQGVKVRSADEDLLHAASALAGIQSEVEAYAALMEQKQYEMALDALVRGYGRCTIHSADAEEWGVADKLTALQDQLDLLLKEQFNVSKRRARKLYKIQKRSEYTLALHEILGNLGLEP